MGVITSRSACARMEKGNVTNILNYLFLDTKRGRQIDCGASLRTFFYYKRYQYRACSRESQASNSEIFGKLVNGSQ